MVQYMKISIIVPYYNGERWISPCLNSLLHQGLSEDDYEIIVIDDGSTHSIEILKRYEQEHSNIKYVRQENQGQCAVRNNGLYMAKGEYIFFCDCDDFIREGTLGVLYDIAKRNNLDVLIHKVKICGEDEHVSQERLTLPEIKCYQSGCDLLSDYMPLEHSGTYISKRRFLLENEMSFDINLIACEDVKFFYEMMLFAKSCGFVNEDVYFYVQHSTSLIHKQIEKELHDKYRDSIIGFLDFLVCLIKKMKADKRISKQVVEELENRQATHTFVLLHKVFRFSSVSKNIEVISRLREIGVYPCKYNQKFQLIVMIMNHYYLWIALCIVFHILPLSLRNKLSNKHD